jgi:pilus assembly protein FimV
MRRRREQESVAVTPPLEGVAEPARQDVGAAVAQDTAPAAAAVAELDPLDEATVYINHGIDTQAEAVLKEAIAKNPGREALHVKLLEIYALRKDTAGFTRHAEEFHRLSGGTGDNWIKVAAMGFGLDPANPLFGGGREATVATVAAPGAVTTNLDFNLDAPADEAAAAAAVSAAPDIELEIPAAGEPGVTPAATVAAGGADSSVDFEVELPTLEVPPATTAPAAAAAQDTAGGMDFKLDLSALDLSLDDRKSGGPAPALEHDPHWHDVQAKFDLVKAYREMGDKAGATEILKEVMREGDAGQQAQAKALLDNLV